MKNPAVNVQRINPIQPTSTETPLSNQLPTAKADSPTKSINSTATRGVPVQQGQSRAAGLRLALAQNGASSSTPATSTKATNPVQAASAGVVIKYAPDQRNARRARSDHPEGVMPLDEEIHHLTGEFPTKARETQQRRKQVLAQRRQVDRGFKSLAPERLEHDADLMTDSWGDDH